MCHIIIIADNDTYVTMFLEIIMQKEQAMENTSRRQAKINAILDSARTVFCRKGFIGVTMKDIIDECGISRGGIYLYFSSVDDVYIAVMNRRLTRKFDDIRAAVKANTDFDTLFKRYFEEHKQRLMHMENSLLRSMYEYFFTHKSGDDHKFQQSQMQKVKETISEILMLGVRQGKLKGDNIDNLAEHFMFEIEGLSVLALFGGLTEECMQRQFSVMESMLDRI